MARPFYVLAQSFTKYLVDRLGLVAVVSLTRGRDPEDALARLTGRDAGTWRAEWLSAGGPTRPADSRAPARAPAI